MLGIGIGISPILGGGKAKSSLLNGLISSWSLNNNLNDNLGVYNGIGTNITYVSGQFGNAAYHDGTSSIDFGNFAAISSTSKFSLSYWIKCTTKSVYSHVGNWNYGTNSGNIYLRNNGNLLDVFIVNGPTTYVYGSYTGFPNNVWTNVIITYDGTQTGNANILKMYINGSQISLSYFGTMPAAMSSTSYNFLVGKIDGLFFPLIGNIDEINMWSRVITPAEITLLQTKAYSF